MSLTRTPMTERAHLPHRATTTKARSNPWMSRLGWASALATSLVLAGCGGGGTEEPDAVPVGGVQVQVVGTTSSYAPVLGGQVLDVAASVGQQVEFDANEPVAWSFSVNGSPLFGSGTTVDVGGVTISQAQVDASHVVLTSGFYAPALLPVDIVLTATSTIDAAQVATIHLQLQ